MDNSNNKIKDKNHRNYRHFIYAVVIFGYLIPVLTYCCYGVIQHNNLSWSFFTIGLLITILGTGVLIFFVRNWEEFMRQKVRVSVREQVDKALEESLLSQRELEVDTNYDVQDNINNLESELGSLQSEYEKQAQYYGQEVTYLKKELREEQDKTKNLTGQLKLQGQEYSKLKQDRQYLLEQCKKFSSKFQGLKEQYISKVGHKDDVVSNHEKKIVHQGNLIEQYKRDIDQLQNRIRDLDYELKTVLELKDIEEDVLRGAPIEDEDYVIYDHVDYHNENDNQDKIFPMWQSNSLDNYNSYDARLELQRCINAAEEISGASRLVNNGSSIVTMFMDNHTIDMRRLFDYYRNIDNNVVFFYSTQEERPIFVNRQVRGLTGLAPERFVSDFYRLIQDSVEDWNLGLQRLQQDGVVTVRLFVKGKSGSGVWLDCHLGLIPGGLFSNNVVGLLCPAA